MKVNFPKLIGFKSKSGYVKAHTHIMLRLWLFFSTNNYITNSHSIDLRNFCLGFVRKLCWTMYAVHNHGSSGTQITNIHTSTRYYYVIYNYAHKSALWHITICIYITHLRGRLGVPFIHLFVYICVGAMKW